MFSAFPIRSFFIIFLSVHFFLCYQIVLIVFSWNDIEDTEIMVGLAKWLTHRIVIPAFIGSNPIFHPSRYNAFKVD